VTHVLNDVAPLLGLQQMWSAVAQTCSHHFETLAVYSAAMTPWILVKVKMAVWLWERVALMEKVPVEGLSCLIHDLATQAWCLNVSHCYVVGVVQVRAEPRSELRQCFAQSFPQVSLLVIA